MVEGAQGGPSAHSPRMLHVALVLSGPVAWLCKPHLPYPLLGSSSRAGIAASQGPLSRPQNLSVHRPSPAGLVDQG